MDQLLLPSVEATEESERQEGLAFTPDDPGVWSLLS
jgi:hypothetical protein